MKKYFNKIKSNLKGININNIFSGYERIKNFLTFNSKKYEKEMFQLFLVNYFFNKVSFFQLVVFFLNKINIIH